MAKWLQVIIIIITLTTCGLVDSDNSFASTILMDVDFLANTKKRILKKDPELKHSFEQLIMEAELALTEGPYSVTDKEKLAPSGDKHDYASYSRYWWPDPKLPNGLPYLRKDGETNPESQNLKTSDRQRIGAFCFHTETLGLAYYLTGKEKYAIKAAELLRVWFLDKETRMNPNVNHAQCRPGHNDGSKSGILDGRLMIRALEGSLLIAHSSALSKTEMKGLKNWSKDYFKWLTTNNMAIQEAASKNNHGSFYDAQAIYFALYSENKVAAKKIAQAFVKKRIHSQIELDGSMPAEMARTRPLFYSIYNLHAMFIVAHLSKKVDVDVSLSKNGDSRLRSGLDYLTPYSDPEKQWPQPTLGQFDRMEIFPILHMANNLYPEGNYLTMIEKLPLERRKIHRSQIAFPLMR